MESISEITKRGYMWRVQWSDGRVAWVTVTKTAHSDSRKWEAYPLLRTSSGSVPLTDLGRSRATRRDAIVAAADAYREAA